MTRHFEIKPTPEFVKVYCIHENGERSVGKMFAFALTKTDAEMIGKGKGWYGGDATIREGVALILNGEYYVIHPDVNGALDPKQTIKEAKEKIKAAGLAKLTDLEKLALGLA